MTTSPQRPFTCPYCHRVCASQEALDEHLERSFAVSIREQLEAAKARETGLDARTVADLRTLFGHVVIHPTDDDTDVLSKAERDGFNSEIVRAEPGALDRQVDFLVNDIRKRGL